MARCGQNISSSLTTDNVLEQTSVQYLVNPYITVDSFTSPIYRTRSFMSGLHQLLVTLNAPANADSRH
jgi:hypothetical protein